MNRTEERLSDALEALASTVHPETLRPLPDPVPGQARRPDPRRAQLGMRWHKGWLGPLAAAAAVVLLAALSVVLPDRTGHAPAPAGPAGQLPRYYAVYRAMPGGNGPYPGDDVIEIRETATGGITDTIDLTRRLGTVPGMHGGYDNSLTATADDRTFFAGFAFMSPTTHATEEAGIYRFNLTGSGHIIGFTRVRDIPVGPGVPNAMAVSPDGGKLALAPSSVHGAPEIMVVDLASGAVTRWAGGLTGEQYANGITQLSWSGDGRILAFEYSARTAPGSSSGYAKWYREVRTLNADLRGGSLASSKLVLSQPPSRTEFLEQAVISPDGKTIATADLLGPYSQQSQLPGDVQVTQVSTPDYGCCDHVLYQGPAGNSTSPFLRGDGAGHWLLTANWKLGWIGGGRLHQLPPGQDGTVTDVAW